MTSECFDWRQSVDVNAILSHPEVVDLISQNAGLKPGGMSGEEFLRISKPVMAAVGVHGVQTELIAKIAQPMYASMGVKTGKEDRIGLRYPPGQTIAATLMSLASRKQPINSIEQAEDGCLLNVGVPSSIYAFAGDMTITLQRHDEGTLVTGAVTIPGQAFDWGRSKRVLKDLFEDVKEHLRSGV